MIQCGRGEKLGKRGNMNSQPKDGGEGASLPPPSNCYVKYVKLTLTSGGIPGSVNPSTTTELSK